jgi:hypothetical protein
VEGFDEWSASLASAEQALVPGELLKLQRQLVFLTLGAAAEVSPGVIRRISGVVLLTPVETGRARSSWNVTLASPSGSYPPPNGTYDQNHAMSQAGGILAQLGPYQTVWIASGLPYIRILEYGGYPNPPVRGSWDRATRQWVVKSSGGFSRQAPQGMVRVTVDAVRAAIGG